MDGPDFVDDGVWVTVRGEDLVWLEVDSFFANCLPHPRVRITNVVVYVPVSLGGVGEECILELPLYDRVFRIHEATLVRKDARTGGMWRGAALTVNGFTPKRHLRVDTPASVKLDGATHIKLRLDVGMVQQWDS